MLDIGWPELIVIGAVALVTIGPKDLPKVMHTMGKWAGKLRAMAHEIQHTVDQLAYEAEVAEKLRKQDEEIKEQAAAPPPSPPPSPPASPSPPPEDEKDHDRAAS